MGVTWLSGCTSTGLGWIICCVTGWGWGCGFIGTSSITLSLSIEAFIIFSDGGRVELNYALLARVPATLPEEAADPPFKTAMAIAAPKAAATHGIVIAHFGSSR